MTIYVSSELRRCICMEKRESRRKLPNYSIHFWNNTDETDPANFRAVCMEDIAAMEDKVQADNFLYNNEILGG